MKKIELTNGMFAIIDDEDYERLSKYTWEYLNGYAIRRQHIKYESGKAIVKRYRMHREIMGTPIGLETDHINGDRLDNRKSNLRICTSAQNKQNRKINRKNTTGYKGVIIEKKTRGEKHYNLIRAQITLDSRIKCLGYYKTLEDAAQAYNEAAIRYFGEFANLNQVRG